MDKMGTPEPTDASFQVMGPKKYILEESTNYWGTAELDGKSLSLESKDSGSCLALPFTNCDLEQCTSL